MAESGRVSENVGNLASVKAHVIYEEDFKEGQRDRTVLIEEDARRSQARSRRMSCCLAARKLKAVAQSKRFTKEET